MRLLLAPLALITVATAAARPAVACSLHPCVRPYLAADGTFPSNARGFVWAVDRESDTPFPDPLPPLVVTVFDTTTSTTLGPLTITQPETFASRWRRQHWVWVTWPQPLVEGHTYAVRADSACEEEPWPDGEPMPGTIVAGPPAALPTAFGTLVVTDSGQRTMAIGAPASCSQDVLVTYTDIELRLAPAAEPWRDVLTVETYVDDVLYVPSSGLGATYPPGATWVGRQRDAIVRVCEGPSSVTRVLPEGVHRVQMRATLPGEPGVELQTEAIEVVLTCPTDAVDAGTPDAGETSRDGGANPVTPTKTDEGCGCTDAPRREGAGAVIVLIGIALVQRRRKRSTSGKSTTSHADDGVV